MLGFRTHSESLPEPKGPVRRDNKSRTQLSRRAVITCVQLSNSFQRPEDVEVEHGAGHPGRSARGAVTVLRALSRARRFVGARLAVLGAVAEDGLELRGGERHLAGCVNGDIACRLQVSFGQAASL